MHLKGTRLAPIRRTLAAVFLTPALLWAAYGTDEGVRHHDGAALKILWVEADQPADQSAGRILIQGYNFLWRRHTNVVVTLAGYTLPIIGTPTATEITAELPAGYPPGTYLLTVSRGYARLKQGRETGQADEFHLTVGGVGPAGPKGDRGDAGAPGEPGRPGPQGVPGILADFACPSGQFLTAVNQGLPVCGEPDRPPSPNKVVFVTSRTFDGNLGGLVGADAKCQEEADANPDAVPSGIYYAWISDGANSPSSRFSRSIRPYALVDGRIVALNYADLTDGLLTTPINLTPEGNPPTAGRAWTGTTPMGLPLSLPIWCPGAPGAWTTNADPVQGLAGDTTATNAAWSSFFSPVCNQPAHLYCFQQ